MSIAPNDAARRMLTEAPSLDEVKRIRDTMIVMQAYAEPAKDTALITLATKIKLPAERPAGRIPDRNGAVDRRSDQLSPSIRKKATPRFPPRGWPRCASSQSERRHPDLAVRQQCRMPGLRAD